MIFPLRQQKPSPQPSTIEKQRSEEEGYHVLSTDDEHASPETTSPVDEQSEQRGSERNKETAGSKIPSDTESAQEVRDREQRYPKRERRKPSRFTINAMNRMRDDDEPLTAQALWGKEPNESMTSMNKTVNTLEKYAILESCNNTQ